MKKRIIFLICFILLLLTLNVNAADNKIVLIPNQTNATPGDIIKIDINVNCETSFEGLTGMLQYNKTKLHLLDDIKNGTGMKDMNDEDAQGNYIITIFPNTNNQNITKATCQTLSFEVLDGVTDGEMLNIALTGTSLKDGDSKIEGLSANTTITVKAETTQNPNSDNNNQPETSSDNNTSGQSSDNSNKTNQIKQNSVSNSVSNNGKDSTQATQEVNYTGAKDYTLGIGIIALIGTVSFIKYRQYKNI